MNPAGPPPPAPPAAWTELPPAGCMNPWRCTVCGTLTDNRRDACRWCWTLKETS